MILISSWDEHGKYDIPAMIDQIISVTEQEKIFYIGHSMGTTGFMVMANDKPAYQDKIHLASFLAPVAVSTCTHITNCKFSDFLFIYISCRFSCKNS